MFFILYIKNSSTFKDGVGKTPALSPRGKRKKVSRNGNRHDYVDSTYPINNFKCFPLNKNFLSLIESDQLMKVLMLSAEKKNI